MIFIRCNNNIYTLLSSSFLLVLSFSLSISVNAEQSKIFGDYEIHYIAYNSNFLSGDVAKIYGVTRSKKQAVIVISVLNKNSPDEGVQAQVNGGATNLIQQLRTLDFNEVREGKAVYYVSTFDFNHEENLTFKLDVTIAPTGETHKLKWQQQFWQD